MKKALIITYYWPPAGGSGVQRWLKFTKYFRDFNIEPIIYTVKNPKYPIIDLSLENDLPKDIEVIRKSIWEPNNLFSFFGTRKTESAGFLDPNPDLIGKIAHYIRANFFIPDARKFWIKPSVRALKKYLKQNRVDVVITTGPPHSVHLIGLGLKKELGVNWIADFRDPWTEIDYFHQLPLTKKSIRKHQILEREVLKMADVVLVVGNTMREKFKEFSDEVKTISNGYDGILEDVSIGSNGKFTLTHIGLMNADRNSNMLWEVLAEICDENDDFRKDLSLVLIGNVASEITNSIKSNELSKYTKVIGYIPHKEVLKYQKQSQVLLIIINKVPSAKGIVTGKIFEYLMVQRPILAIAPIDGDLAQIINDTRSGFVVGFDDKNRLKQHILDLYVKFKQEKLITASRNIEQYHRKELTKKLSEIIKSL